MVEKQAVWCCSKCGAVYHKDFPRCPSDGAEVVLAIEDPILGTSIGHYRIDTLIGEGGMGRVYRARHVHLPDKRYAVKVLLGDAAATPSMRKRFTKEAEHTSRLDHANVIHVVDYGSMEGGLPYIVMDFVEGRSLGALIDEGAMEAARVIRLARAVCEGLAYAHESGVVHRDLKPDNILVTKSSDGDEVPRIADFGLAMTNAPGELRLTSTGMAMGTPAYSAPEQFACQRIDHRADLYALGMTMFEMLTGGILPFDGTAMEVIAAKSSRELPPVAAVAPTVVVPPELEQVIRRLVQRRPADRFASARDVIAALDDVVLGLPLDERAATVHDPERLATPLPVAPPRRARRGLLAGVGAIAIAVGGWALLQRTRGVEAALVTAPVRPQAALATAPLRPNAPSVAPITSPTAPVAVEPREPATIEPETIEPETIEMDPLPSRLPARQPAHKRSHPRTPAREARLATEPSAPAKAPAIVAQAIVPPPIVAPPILAPLEARIASIDVAGSLPNATIRRAVDRITPAIRACTPTGTPVTARVQFTIDQSQRPAHLRGSNAAPPTIACLVGAFAGLRSESAPDVGDTEVSVQIAFRTGS